MVGYDRIDRALPASGPWITESGGGVRRPVAARWSEMSGSLG